MPTPELSDSQLSTLNSQPAVPERRRRGKIARLPKILRDRINQQLHLSTPIYS